MKGIVAKMGLFDWIALDRLLDNGSSNNGSGCGCVSFIALALGFFGIFVWKDMFDGSIENTVIIIVVIAISIILSILNKGININTVVVCYFAYVIIAFIFGMINNQGAFNSIFGALMLAGTPATVMFLLSLIFEKFSE